MWRFVPRIMQTRAVLLLGALIIGVSSGNSAAGDRDQIRAEKQLTDVSLDDPFVTGGNGARNAPHSTIASQLLKQAIAAHDAGNAPEAQRQFEALLGGYPTSPEAATARRDLARLYAANVTEDASVQLVVAGQQSPVARMSVGTGNGAESHNWKTSERLSDLMRTAVGDRVFFAQGSTDLGLQARNVVRGQAGWLKQQHAGVRALVIGHADEPLDDEGNTILSARRAEAVRARLIEEGVAPERVSVTALGRSERVADCPSPQCKAQNRRVVTSVLEPGSSGAANRQGYYQTPKEGEAPAGW